MKQIILNHGKIAVVDDEDFPHLNSFRWCAHWNGASWEVVRFLRCKPGSKGTRSILIKMQHDLLGHRPGFEVICGGRRTLRTLPTPTESTTAQVIEGLESIIADSLQ